MARVAGRRGVGVPGLATPLVRAVAAGRAGCAGDAGAGPRGNARSGRRGRRGPGRAGAHRARHRCAPGTLRQAYRHRRDHLVPAVQRARCRLGPGRADHPGRGGRRRVAGDRAEGLVDRSGDRGLRTAAGPYRCQRAQAPWHHLFRAPDASAGGRGAPAAADERALLVQRGVPGSGQSPGRLPHRGAGRWLDGRAVDPRARAPSRRVPARPGAAPESRGGRAGLAGGDRGADRRQRAAQVVSAAGRPAGSGHRPGDRARPGGRPAGAPGDRPAGGAGLVGAVDGRTCRRRARGGPVPRAGRLAGQAGQQRHRPAGGAGTRADRRAARHAGRPGIAAGRDDRRDLPVRAGHLDRRRHRPDPADDHRRADPRPAQGARSQPESALPRGAR